jgi:predicted dithiol-disulfide oxidoreductase (DUF899 family)
MNETKSLVPAAELAAANKAHCPNESPEYRRARNELLVKEIELRRQIERVAEERRALPLGGEIPKDYEFISESGSAKLSDLFRDKETLMVYSMMFGPEREGPCPGCTGFLLSWNGAAVNLQQKVSVVVTARSPIERLLQYKQRLNMDHLPVASDPSGDYTRAYVSEEDADVPGLTVFTRGDGKIRHFYSCEISGDMADPGQDPRDAVDLDQMWLMLDLTREGRGTDWYPKLDYVEK